MSSRRVPCGSHASGTHQANDQVCSAANELAERPGKWFLGLPDESTDVVVLLCRALDRSMHDLVLPLADLGDLWERLSRSRGEVKFHVEQKGREFYLAVPRGESLVVTKYKANYLPLR